MATIVEYTIQKPPENRYPIRIVSPPVSNPCCTNSSMERVGQIENDEGRTYYYRRCRKCGYTVRHFPVPVLPDRLSEGIDLRALVEIFAEK
jgi:hypothetical protein